MGSHSGFTMIGNVDAVNTYTIINLKAPVNPNDAARLVDVAGGAPVGASYLTLGLNGALTAERVLTAGEGIDFADTGANGTLTINGEDASLANKGIAKFAAGEGLDVGAVAGTITYSAEDSAVGNKGVIIVAGGEGIGVNYVAGTATISGEDSAVGNKGIIIVEAGEGIDVNYVAGTATVSGEDATIANKGIASFNTNDFTVVAGAVSIKTRTRMISFSPDSLHLVGGSNLSTAASSSHRVIVMPNADSTSEANVEFVVPSDFSSGNITYKIYWIGDNAAAGNAYFTRGIEYGKVGEFADNSSSSNTVASATNGAGRINVLSWTPSETYEVGDVIWFNAQRLGAHINDTLGDDVEVLALSIEYTSVA